MREGGREGGREGEGGGRREHIEGSICMAVTLYSQGIQEFHRYRPKFVKYKTLK